MPLVADRCICVRRIEYSETSQILTLFGRQNGLVRVIAKGAHRTTKAGASKFGGGIDLLDVAAAVFSQPGGRDLPPLTEWRLLEGHRELRHSLRGVYLATYAAELLTTLLEEHDPHPDLFDRVEHTLAELAVPRLAEQSFLALELDLLRETGYLPELSSCVNCGRPAGDGGRASFSTEHGGVVCRNCEAAYPSRLEIDPRLLRIAQSVLQLPRAEGAALRLPALTRHQTDPLNRLLADHVRYVGGRELRLARYVLARPPAAVEAGVGAGAPRPGL